MCALTLLLTAMCVMQMGELRGHESTQVTFSFTPAVQQVYSARAALMLLPPRTTGSITTAAHDTAVSLAAGSLDDPEQALHETVEGDQVLQQAAQPAYEKLITTIIGEATQGALSVEPADISFGVVKVGYPLHRPLTLINQSDGVLHYRIEIVYQLGDGVDGNTAACEFALPVQGESDSDDGSSRRCSIDAQIDEPEGVIGARYVTSHSYPTHQGATVTVMITDRFAEPMMRVYAAMDHLHQHM